MKTELPIRNGAVPLAILLPHAPILIPAVAGVSEAECRTSMRAMAEAARRLVAARPETVLLVSPHAQRVDGAFGVSEGNVSGTLARFGARETGVKLPGDPELTGVLRELATERGLATERLPATALDHGSVVPLWYLTQAGWTGPTVVVALAAEDNARLGELGECVAAAAAKRGRRVAVVASGDMSHRLRPGAPCGYDPQAGEFDAAFIRELRAGATRGLAAAVAPSQERAAEDVVEATLFALGAVGWSAAGREVLGYEGPFGVGYGVAVLFSAGETGEPWAAAVDAGAEPLMALPGVARASIATALGLAATLEEPRVGGCPGRGGVFVTLHEAGGRLHGCIGTLVSRTGDLAVETWRMARAAALRDPRFPPVRAEELDALKIEVTVLGPLEEIESEAELDPRLWGVVVSAADGRRGLLLPDLPEVTTVEQQVSGARRKAGIGPEEPVRLQRFAACRCTEVRRK